MFEKAINSGREIVIVPSDQDNSCMSSLFWKEGEVIYCFCRSFGIIARPEMTVTQLSKHIEKMFIAGAKIFVRGYKNENHECA